MYFITICVKDHVCVLGEIVDGKMILNEAGEIAQQCWLAIPEHFPNAVLHEFVIMPNHVHGIVELMDSVVGRAVGAQNFEPLQRATEQPPQNKFQKIIPRSIGSIVRGFKIGVTKWFRANTEIKIVWQRNFYERIVRDEEAYHAISNYIVNNPAKWNEDDFFKPK